MVFFEQIIACIRKYTKKGDNEEFIESNPLVAF